MTKWINAHRWQIIGTLGIVLALLNVAFIYTPIIKDAVTGSTPAKKFFGREDWVPAQAKILEDNNLGCLVAVYIENGPMIITWTMHCKDKK